MDHISVPVTDVARTKAFYEAILMPLGWTCSGWRADVYVGFKKRGSPALYFGAADRAAQVHLAFKADSEEKVKEFHRAALDAGAVDNGKPGPRPDYGAAYYAAFALDPDGHNVEAVVGGVGEADAALAALGGATATNVGSSTARGCAIRHPRAEPCGLVHENGATVPTGSQRPWRTRKYT